MFSQSIAFFLSLSPIDNLSSLVYKKVIIIYEPSHLGGLKREDYRYWQSFLLTTGQGV